MARESKRKRDEKRFGRPERLIDMTTEFDWCLPAWINPEKDKAGLADALGTFRKFRPRIEHNLARATCIVADNVVEYIDTVIKDKDIAFARDCPCPKPPFPITFVEYSPYAGMPPEVGRIGCLFVSVPRGQSERMGFVPPPKDESDPVSDRYRADDYETAVEVVGLHQRLGNLVVSPFTRFVYLLDERGNMIGESLSFNTFTFRDRSSVESLCLNMITPAMLALSFTNCKNVAMSAVAPDAAVNRLRQANGRQPFVRYHTINIEPMKATLRAEGNIEANGLKKALHICRGHFATYTPDKPLFGHFTGTVWKPAHVRGSSKNGVVVSDYDVKSPGQLIGKSTGFAAFISRGLG